MDRVRAQPALATAAAWARQHQLGESLLGAGAESPTRDSDGRVLLALLPTGRCPLPEQYGFMASPSTILWHAKTKDAHRPPLLQRFMETRHCSRSPAPGPPRCRDGRRDQRVVGGSCAGGKWVFCSDESDAGRCAHAKINLLNRTSWEVGGR